MGVCKSLSPGGSTTVGMVKDSSCYYVYGGIGVSETNATAFDVLTGTGFQWMNRPTSVTTIPTNAYQAGVDGGPEFVGRCNIHSDIFIGKIYNVQTFRYGYNGKEMNDCQNPDILLYDQDASG